MRLSVVVVLFAVAGTAGAQDAPALKTSKDKISYALGMDLGNQFRKSAVDVDPAVFAQALKDALAGGKTLLTQEQARAAISELQEQLKKQGAPKEAAGAKFDENKLLAQYNKATGEKFLADNKGKPGVIVLPSGLQYKVVKAGNGPKPKAGDAVTCNYRGTLLSGAEIYSTEKDKQPAKIKVDGVIKGLTEALQLMPVGSKWEIVVPPGLAYGEAAAGPIGPNSTLKYELELLAIN